MEAVIHNYPDRRMGPDRRSRSTGLLDVFRYPGRRRGFRRADEHRNQYVDCPSAGAIAMVLWIVLCSTLDALFTLLHLQNGGEEANPVMAWALNYGVGWFVASKSMLTFPGILFLALHEHFRSAWVALYSTTIAYTVLLVYHVALLIVH